MSDHEFKPHRIRDVSPVSAEDRERIMVSEERLVKTFEGLLTGLAERQYRTTQDVWLGCNNALAKECSRFERLIAELRGEIHDLKARLRALESKKPA